MHSEDSSAGLASLLGITIRRSFVSGRIYLVVGTGLSLFYAVILAAVPGSTFAYIFPLLLPVLATLGALGGLMVFTTDRLKGVFEYLIAYGISPRRIFLNALVASLVLVSVVLGATLAAGLGVYWASGHAISVSIAEALGLYSVPMSYACVAFAGTVGMFWTSLSTPREGMNSPIGLVPIICIAPAIAVLVIVVATGPSTFLLIGGTAVVLVAVTVVALVTLMGRLMHRERLLSPA